MDISRETVEWREIPSLPNYLISNDGRVFGKRRRKVRKVVLDRKGYSVVTVWNDGRFKIRKVAQLVAEAFLGPRPDGMVIRHLDGNPLNNRSENLTYGTQAENVADTFRMGRAPVRAKNGRAKLTEAEVETLRALHRAGATKADLLARFAIGKTQLWHITSGRQWK